jgi:hypothetical protein
MFCRVVASVVVLYYWRWGSLAEPVLQKLVIDRFLDGYLSAGFVKPSFNALNRTIHAVKGIAEG